MWYPSWHQLKFPLAFICASAIHGGLLGLPMPQAAVELDPIAPTQDSDESPEEAIATIPLAALTPPTPDPTPEPIPESTAEAPVNPTPVSQRQATPPPQPQPTPDSEAKTPEPEPTPEPTPDWQAKTIEPEPTPEPTPEPRQELVAGIPHLEGAEPGCHGSLDCHFLEGATVRAVTQDLQGSLEAQGFQWRLSYRDTGLRVYEISREDQPPQFLHIASDNAGRDTFYVLAPQQQTLEELRSR